MSARHRPQTPEYSAAAVPETTWVALDKVGHFIAYGALATAIIRHPAFGTNCRGVGSAPRSNPWRLGWLAALLASAYGLGDEFRQSLTAGIRQYDLTDWAADTIGALVGVTFYLHWGGYRRLLETRVGWMRAKPRVETSPEPLPNLAE